MKDKEINILLIDDNKASVKLVRRAFKGKGNNLSLTVATNYDDAKVLIEKLRPDLLISGIEFFDNMGNDLINYINAPVFPVLILSADSDRSEKDSFPYNTIEYIKKTKENITLLPHFAEKAILGWNYLMERIEIEKELNHLKEKLDARIEENAADLLMLNEELRKSEKRFRLIAENTADIIWTMDMSLRYTYCSPSVKQLRGFTPEEVMEQTMEEVFTPDSLRRIIEVLSNIVKGIDDKPKDMLIAQAMEVDMLCKEGRTIPVEITMTLIRDDKGEPVGIHGLARDISERKKAEQALLEQKEMYQALFENNHSVMLLINPATGSIIDANPAACTFYGYPKNLLTRMRLKEITIQDESELSKYLDDAINTRTHHFHFQHRISGGYIKDVEIYSGPIKVGGKELLYSIINDITERKKTEEEIKKIKDYNEHLLKISPSAIFTVDSEMTITSWNLKSSEITGYSAEEVIGKKCAALPLCSHCEQCLLFSEGIVKPVIDRESRLATKNGETRTILRSLDIIKDIDGNIVGGIESFTDITRLKIIEEKLKISITEKEALIKEIHNWIKNNLYILSSIFNEKSSLVMDENAKGFYLSTINRIELMAFIHELLYQAENMSEIDFSKYIEESIKYMIQMYNVKKDDIKFEINVKNIFINVDMAMSCALIINEAVSNSIEHAFPNRLKGKIKIKFFRDKNDENNFYHLMISDNGIGINKKIDASKAQTPGFRFIHSLVHQLRGKIEIESKKGTTLKILFS